MEAALILPAESRIEVIDLDPDIKSWKRRIGADDIDHQTLSFSPDLLAIVDDAGLAKGLPQFTIFAPAVGKRIALAGPTLVIGSDDEQFIDLTSEHIKQIDVRF